MEVVDQIDTRPLVLAGFRRAFIDVDIAEFSGETRGARAAALVTGAAIVARDVLADIYRALATMETGRAVAVSGGVVARAPVLTADDVVTNSDVTAKTNEVGRTEALPGAVAGPAIQADVAFRFTHVKVARRTYGNNHQ